MLQCAQFLRISEKNCLLKNLSCSINSSFACLKPQSHICDKFSLSLKHSMNFYKDHIVTCMKLKFIVFLMKKPLSSASKMSEHSCWGVFMKHMETWRWASLIWVRTFEQTKNCS